MNKFLLLFCLVTFRVVSLFSQGEPHSNLYFGSRWYNPAQDGQYMYLGVYGFAVGNNEYAIVGKSDSIVFFNVTNPNITPIKIIGFEMTNYASWVEFTPYKDVVNNKSYILAVAESAGDGLQIFDITDVTNITRTINTNFFTLAHDIEVDSIQKKLFVSGTGSESTITVLNITNINSPTLIKHFTVPSVSLISEIKCLNNLLFCSAPNNGLYIYNFKFVSSDNDTDDPNLIVSNSNFKSSSAGVKPDTSLIVSVLNTLGSKIKNISTDDIVDFENFDFSNDINQIADYSNPLLSPTYTNNNHRRCYLKDNILFVANHQDGVQKWDISNPSTPIHLAYYDTDPTNSNYTTNSILGCWAVYPYLPSENVLVVDVFRGLYVLRNTDQQLALNTSIRLHSIKTNNNCTLKWQILDADSLMKNITFKIFESDNAIDFTQVARVSFDFNDFNQEFYFDIQQNPTKAERYFFIELDDNIKCRSNIVSYETDPIGFSTVIRKDVSPYLNLQDIINIETVHIYDTSSKLCLAESATKNIDISNLKSGIYLVNCFYKTGKIKTFRLLIL